MHIAGVMGLHDHDQPSRSRATTSASSHATADAAPVPGRRTLTQDLPPGALISRTNLTGHYVGERNTAEINQVGETIVGRLATRRRDHDVLVLNTYSVVATLAWDNAGSTGFRGTQTMTRGSHVGRRGDITLVFSGTDQVRIELAQVETTMQAADGITYPVAPVPPFDLARRSSEPAASPMMVDQASPLDRAAETMPLDAATEARRAGLVIMIAARLRGYYESDTDLQRSAFLSELGGNVSEVFQLVPEVQHALFAARMRISLARERRQFRESDRTLLDWLTMALRRELSPAGHNAADLLELPFGDDAREVAVPHTYTFTFVEDVAESPIPLPPPVTAEGRSGTLTVTEILGPGCEESWSRDYPVVRGSVGFALGRSIGGSVTERSTATATVTDHWRPDDFIGPIGGLAGSAGGSIDGPRSGRTGPEDEVLEISGDGSFAPIVLHPETETVTGAGAGIGVDISLQHGAIRGTRPDAPIPADSTADHEHGVHVPVDVRIEIAFDTDVTTLTPRGVQAIRELVAWNLAVLHRENVRVVVDGLASRRWTTGHNLGLSQDRQRTVVELLRSLVPGLNVEPGEALGEEVADVVVPDDPDDDSQQFRSARIWINGTVTLDLFGEMGPIETSPPRVMGDQ